MDWNVLSESHKAALKIWIFITCKNIAIFHCSAQVFYVPRRPNGRATEDTKMPQQFMATLSEVTIEERILRFSWKILKILRIISSRQF